VAALLDDRPTLMFIVVNAPADADADGGAPSRHVVDGAAVEKSAFSFPVASLVPAAAPYLWSRDGAAAANTVPLVKPDWQFSRIRLPRRIHGTAFT